MSCSIVAKFGGQPEREMPVWRMEGVKAQVAAHSFVCRGALTAVQRSLAVVVTSPT